MWRTTVPTTGTSILDIAVIFPENWEALETILGEEHYTFTPPAELSADELSGRHIAGKTAVLCSDATTGITGVTPPGSGAIGFDTTLGSLVAYLDSSWTWVGTFLRSYIKAYIDGGDQSIPPSGAAVEFNTKIDDDTGEYNTTTYTFTPAADGFFFIKARVSITAVGGVVIVMKIVHNDSNDDQKNSVDNTYIVPSDASVSVRNQAILEVAAGDKIHIHITHDRITDIIAEAGSDRSVLIIKRVS